MDVNCTGPSVPSVRVPCHVKFLQPVAPGANPINNFTLEESRHAIYIGEVLFMMMARLDMVFLNIVITNRDCFYLMSQSKHTM
jgi:hypothetical protein